VGGLFMDIRRVRLLFSKIQNVLDEEISLMDDTGYIIDSTNSAKIGDYDTSLNLNKIDDTILEVEDRLYYLINTRYGKDLIIAMEGSSIENKRLLQVVGIFLTDNLNNLTREDFIKGIILKEFHKDEVKDICSKFNLKYNSNAQVIAIKLSEDIIHDGESIITNMHPEKIVVKLNSTTLACIKIVNDDGEGFELGQNIYDTIFSELLYEPIIGVGTLVRDLSCLHQSYEKANLYIRLGKYFIEDRKIYSHKDLILPIIIDDLDTEVLKEISKLSGCNLEDILMDNELMLTATKFLENNLNISDTARKLYVHRNTLIYRLNKIHNITGLDLRSFKDAVNFNMLITVMKYIQKHPK
jgi:carbohydrate diacid regulator